MDYISLREGSARKKIYTISKTFLFLRTHVELIIHFAIFKTV